MNCGTGLALFLAEATWHLYMLKNCLMYITCAERAREVTALHQQIVAYTDGQTDLSYPTAQSDIAP